MNMDENDITTVEIEKRAWRNERGNGKKGNSCEMSHQKENYNRHGYVCIKRVVMDKREKNYFSEVNQIILQKCVQLTLTGKRDYALKNIIVSYYLSLIFFCVDMSMHN